MHITAGSASGQLQHACKRIVSNCVTWPCYQGEIVTETDTVITAAHTSG